MGLFGRKRAAAADPAVAPAGPTTGHHEKHAHNGHGHRQRGAGGFGGMPSFGQWIKVTGLDILTMAIMGAIGLGVSRDKQIS
jgi:diacylglycerol diphosphate phosphatase/phosphatidate phosphatase